VRVIAWRGTGMLVVAASCLALGAIPEAQAASNPCQPSKSLKRITEQDVKSWGCIYTVAADARSEALSDADDGVSQCIAQSKIAPDDQVWDGVDQDAQTLGGIDQEGIGAAALGDSDIADALELFKPAYAGNEADTRTLKRAEADFKAGAGYEKGMAKAAVKAASKLGDHDCAAAQEQVAVAKSHGDDAEKAEREALSLVAKLVR
jgi:hypothetical protein